MATVNKDFKIKNGLIVEGTTGTINNYDILTKNQDDIDYIIDQVGGSGVSTATPNTLVLRDGNADFAANMITADLTGDVTGTVSSLSNHDTDDLSEGTSNKYFTEGRVKDVLTGSTQTNISITEVGGVLHITAENGVADSTTDDLDEGTTNKYYTDARVDNHLSGGDGINYSSGTISADLGTGLHISGGQIEIDRSAVDTWYDYSGAASNAAGNVQDNLDSHVNSSSVHGVSGNVVGTSDAQELSNKTISGTLAFGSANTNDSFIEGEYDGAGNLTVHAGNNLNLTTQTGDIVLNADGGSYIGSVSAGNEIATNAYVDNAVSGLTWKQAVNVRSTVNNVTLTGSTPLILDNHTLADGYRVLLAGQSTDANNGIYDLAISGGSYTLTRSADADTYEELVGSAVFVMEGDQYGQTSWVQSNHYLSAFTGQSWTQFSGSGSVVAGTGITVDGLEVSIDRTTVDIWYEPAGAVADHNDLTTGVHGVTGDVVGTSDTQTLSNKTIDGAKITGKTSFRDGSDNEYAFIERSYTGTTRVTSDDDLALRSHNGDIILYPGNDDGGTGKAYIHWGDDAWNAYPEREIATHGWVEDLTTDSFDEGSTNKYYTDQRVKDVLTGSQQSNISITQVGSTLIIAAENGVADSTTDDLAEGANNHYFTDERAQDAVGLMVTGNTETGITVTYDDANAKLNFAVADQFPSHSTSDLAEGSNLYFTDARAVSALENVVPNFTEIDINSVATQVAATTGNIATASTVTAYSFAKADYRSAKFLVKCAYSTHTEVSEVLLTLDSSDNIAITEYAIVGTNGSSMNISADVNGGDVRLRVATVNNNSTLTVVGTLVA